MNSDNNTFTFCGASPTEISYLHNLSSNAQTQLNACLKDNSTTSLTGNISLTNTGSNKFTFAGVTPTEIAYSHSVTCAIQPQLDNCIKKSGTQL